MFSTSILVLSAFFTSAIAGECTDSCKEPTLLYESLKCKPIFTSSEDCCPIKYDCSHIEERASSTNEKCYFHGKSYNLGEKIDNNEVYGTCRAGCFCEKNTSGRMGFTCAYFDCPRGGPLSKPECHLKYKLDHCCNSGEVCPPFSTTCEVNGKVYHEHERFDAPGSNCTRCVCQKGFKGVFEAPVCKKQECFDEVSYQTRVMNFCAPSYINLDDCCPFNWICPDNDDVIQTSNSTETIDLKCKFGTKLLNVGDKFERTDSSTGGRLSCECRLPPYLTCIQDYQYSTYSGEF